MDKEIPLGKDTHYEFHYNAGLLFPIARSQAQQSLGELPVFYGLDIWTAYELSWLNQNGLPCVAIAQLSFACNSPNLIESKSLKLYLNSFNQTRLAGQDALKEILLKDLAAASGGAVDVVLFPVNDFAIVVEDGFVCLEQLPMIEALHFDEKAYDTNAAWLKVGQQIKAQRYCSHLFRSLCPVTGQPDWASIYIECEGLSLDEESLLRYLVSFRQHQGFHEQCVEKIYSDLLELCQASSLTVSARFLRRGGLDINPIRSSHQGFSQVARQARQ